MQDQDQDVDLGWLMTLLRHTVLQTGGQTAALYSTLDLFSGVSTKGSIVIYIPKTSNVILLLYNTGLTFSFLMNRRTFLLEAPRWTRRSRTLNILAVVK